MKSESTDVAEGDSIELDAADDLQNEEKHVIKWHCVESEDVTQVMWKRSGTFPDKEAELVTQLPKQQQREKQGNFICSA